MQMNLHTGSREDGLGSDGEEDESDDLDLYLGLHMDEVCTKGNKIKKTKRRKDGGLGVVGGWGEWVFNYSFTEVVNSHCFIQFVTLKFMCFKEKAVNQQLKMSKESCSFTAGMISQFCEVISNLKHSCFLHGAMAQCQF